MSLEVWNCDQTDYCNNDSLVTVIYTNALRMYINIYSMHQCEEKNELSECTFTRNNAHMYK